MRHHPAACALLSTHLTYMIGQLKILELRAKAQRALGPRFDIRRFHGAVLDQGQVPMGPLEPAIDQWIAAEMKSG
jgi:uncharacterized protein (DUF885 family)